MSPVCLCVLLFSCVRVCESLCHIGPSGTVLCPWQFVFTMIYHLHECITITEQIPCEESVICINSAYTFSKENNYFFSLNGHCLCSLSGSLFLSFRFVSFFPSCMLLFALRCVPTGSAGKGEQVCWLAHCTHKHPLLQKASGGLDVSLEIVPVLEDLKWLSHKRYVVV